MNTRRYSWFFLVLAALVIIILYVVTGIKSRSMEGGGKGYVMALHYYDQMTTSTLNLISLQCWAHSLALKDGDSHQYVEVVEPFVRRSVLGLDDQHRIHMNNTAEHLKSVTLSDVYDIAEWEHFAASREHYAPLVSWEYFLENSPRKMIIVERECLNEKKCMECGDGRTNDLLRSIEVLQGRYGFKVVRRVCHPMKKYQNGELQTLLYGDYTPDEVVLVFNYWGGIEDEGASLDHRMGLSDLRQCERREQFGIIHIPLSTRIKEDARHYMNKYIKSTHYISVMVRLEYFYIKHDRFKGKSSEEILQQLGNLYNKILTQVDMFKVNHSINDVLLTMDCRKQGSESLMSGGNVTSLMSDSISILYKKLYGNSSTLEEWDQSFYNVSSFKTEGYLAMLQKYLAINGTCLITAGGGSFQWSAIDMYKKEHSKRCTLAI
jgi:hypothetical protein